MFKKLLEKFPYLVKRNEEIKEKLIKQTVRELYLLKDSFKAAVSYEDTYKALKRILTDDRLAIQIERSRNKSTKVSFHTTTSQNALELVSRECYGYESLQLSNTFFSMEPKEKPFFYWESSEESISLLYTFMKRMVLKAVLTYEPIEDKKLEGNVITQTEIEFIDSLLFKYLCNDLITLLIFYLEESNETT